MQILVKVVSRVCWAALRPVTSARSLADYSSFGYRALGLVVVVMAVATLTWAGPLRGGVSAIPAGILTVIVVGYVVAGLYRETRHWIGRLAADSALWLLRRVVDAGEWCIANRAGATVAALALLATSALLAQLLIARGAQAARYEAWLSLAEAYVVDGNYLLDSNGPAGSVSTSWETLESSWEPVFDSMRSTQDRSLPFTLNEILGSHLSVGSTSSTHMARLAETGRALTPLLALPWGPEGLRDGRETVILSVLGVKVHLRLAGSQCSAPELVTAYAFLNRIPAFDPINYERSNDIGIISACSTLLVLRGARAPIPELCLDAADCFGEAMRGFAEPARSDLGCTFERTRAINNQLDLVGRMAVTFPDASELVEAGILRALADRLPSWVEVKADELGSCLATWNIVAGFVTLASAHALLAQLAPAAWAEHTLSAGSAIGRAFELSPKLVDSSDLSPLCGLLTDGQLPREFEAGVRAATLAFSDAIVGSLARRMSAACTV